MYHVLRGTTIAEGHATLNALPGLMLPKAQTNALNALRELILIQGQVHALIALLIVLHVQVLQHAIHVAKDTTSTAQLALLYLNPHGTMMQRIPPDSVFLNLT